MERLRNCHASVGEATAMISAQKDEKLWRGKEVVEQLVKEYEEPYKRRKNLMEKLEGCE